MSGNPIARLDDLEARLADLQARYDELEQDALALSSFASQRAARRDLARRAWLAEVRRRADPNEIRALSPPDRHHVLNSMPEVVAWCLSTDDPREWTRDLPRPTVDQIEVHLVHLPRRVRVSGRGGNSTFRGEWISISQADYERLFAAGLGSTTRQIDSTTIGYRSEAPEYGQIWLKEHHDVILSVDHNLRRWIAEGSVTVHELSPGENRAYQLQQWSRVPPDERDALEPIDRGPAPPPARLMIHEPAKPRDGFGDFVDALKTYAGDDYAPTDASSHEAFEFSAAEHTQIDAVRSGAV